MTQRSNTVIQTADGEWTIRPSRASFPSMIFQHPLELTAKELDPICEVSYKTPWDVAQGLVAGAYQIYRVGTILTMVSVVQNRLVLNAIVQEGRPGSYWREFVKAVKELASEWGCDGVETTTSDPRIRRLIELVGARIDSWNMFLEV